MAQNKKNRFDPDDLEFADFAKALSHPARVAILKTLAARETCICGEIVEIMPLAQSTVSQHLKELRKIGLVRGTIDGPRSCYCIDREKLKRFCACFGDLLKEL